MKVINKVLIKVYDSDISENGKFIVPNNVAMIGGFAFYGRKSLKEVIIPEGVTEIGDSAFWRCVSLEEVVIPNSVTEIGNYAF